ncbi:arylamine N-acetyltransferase, pineal gland isozyme NAT-10-like [Gouania willdenowi]|uniref:arylamine N-acetyltransferase n=1 Tax=Gouania willdenowi TaxID=441366 RepID=A0A8C5DJ73_GOUWI|nr:arylamine N-acetyltransferase, pineal gland isozyme NAT-10-like [Gouania willdenowi]
MNLEEYFERIGFHGYFGKPDLATLKLIHKLHVMSIPFENLNIHCGETMTMDIVIIYDKIVKGKRGGWCLENNSLFGWVMREMGYDCVTLGSRVFESIQNQFGPDETHLIHKVMIDGQAYIADVSFGVSYQVWEPLELISEKEQPQAAGIFYLRKEEDVWVLEKTARKQQVVNPEFINSSLLSKEQESKKKIYCFTLEPRHAHHFFEVNQKLQTDPTSLFIKKSICSLQTPTGFKALIGLIYSEVTFKPDEGVDVFEMRNITESEIEKILREHFNVKLQNKLLPTNKKTSYTL